MNPSFGSPGRIKCFGNDSRFLVHVPATCINSIGLSDHVRYSQESGNGFWLHVRSRRLNNKSQAAGYRMCCKSAFAIRSFVVELFSPFMKQGHRQSRAVCDITEIERRGTISDTVL